MIAQDKLRIKILKLLHSNKDMTIGQIKRATKVAHHYTIKNALEFLENIGLIEIKEKKDKLKSKIVKLKET